MKVVSRRFNVGDRIRIDIPDKSDPDHNRLHGKHGEITDVLEDDADEETGDPRDSSIYRVRLTNDEEVDLRWRDLRPPLKD